MSGNSGNNSTNSNSGNANATPTVFALTPGQLNPNDILDLSDKLGRDTYNKAIQPLDIKFDGDSKNINLFQTQLSRRAENSGWNKGSGDIINISDSSGTDKNLITEYGCLSDIEIKTSVSTYINARKMR